MSKLPPRLANLRGEQMAACKACGGAGGREDWAEDDNGLIKGLKRRWIPCKACSGSGQAPK